MTDPATQGQQTGDTNGSGAPTDAPGKTAQERAFSQDEVNTFGAQEKRRGREQGATEERQRWLVQLGAQTPEEADALIKQLAKLKPQVQKSDADKAAEAMKADYEKRVAELEAARLAAEERANREAIRSFALRFAGDTNDPDLAMAVLGVPFEPEHKLTLKDGKLVVTMADGTELPHKDPEKWAQEVLAKKPFLQKPRGEGAGGRVAPSAAPKESDKPRRYASRQDELQALAEYGQAKGMGNGRG